MSQSNFDIIAKKLLIVFESLERCSIELDTIKDNHMSDEVITFYALKGFFDGRVVKFFIDRRKYVRIWGLENIRKLFSIKESHNE